MLTVGVARMAIQAAAAALLLSRAARVWELVVLQAFAGTGTAFFGPASTGLTPVTVSAGRLQEANARRGAGHGFREHAVQHAGGDGAAAARPAGVTVARQCL
jgi:hypothetical protein